MAKKREKGENIVATNRKAFHDFNILEKMEAGIVLQGMEVKSLREGRANLRDSFARIRNGEVYLYNVHISPYSHGRSVAYDPRRTRKLLLHRHEIARLIGKINEKGLTLVPLSIYFKRGKAKVDLAVARGKKLYDKREELKARAHEREIAQALKSVKRKGDE
jgi:SsrA-binding protein